MSEQRTGNGRGALLWVIAVVLMAGAYSYQKRTGPTYPLRGTRRVYDAEVRYELLRSHETTEGAPISVPSPEGKVTGVLHWKNYPTEDPFTAAPMTHVDILQIDEILSVGHAQFRVKALNAMHNRITGEQTVVFGGLGGL